MSTKPPTAVMMPSVSLSGFKAVLDLLQLVGMGAKLLGMRIVWLLEQGLDLSTVARVRLSQRRRRRLELVAQPAMHTRDVGSGEFSLGCLVVDERPLGRHGTRLRDILQIGRGPFRASRKQKPCNQRCAHHALENRLGRAPFR